MKTLNVKVLYTLIIFFTSFLGLGAQHTHIISDGTVLNPQLQLEEEVEDQYARIKYANSNSADFWALSGRTGNGDLDIFGAFFNNSPRFLYINEDQKFQVSDNVLIKPVQGSTPSLTLDIEEHDNANINFTSNDGDLGSIKAVTNQNGSAHPDRISMISPGSTNFMSLTASNTRFADQEIAYCINCSGEPRVSIYQNSTSTDQHLRLVEDVANSYARIGFYNSGTSDRWNLGGRATTGFADMVFSYNGDHTLYLKGEANRVAVNTANPDAHFHIKQLNNGLGALLIENDNNTNTWSWRINDNDMRIYYNGTYKGYWDDADGSYVELSDKRLKHDINKLSDGVLPKLLNLEATSYNYNDNKESDAKSIGFIAQDVQKIFPEIVTQMDDDAEVLGIKYSKLAVLAVKAIQEQQDIINQQAASIKEKEVELSKVKLQMDAMLERIERLEEL